jgi:hypothetical protein
MLPTPDFEAAEGFLLAPNRVLYLRVTKNTSTTGALPPRSTVQAVLPAQREREMETTHG